jgi:hypothetical protein
MGNFSKEVGMDPLIVKVKFKYYSLLEFLLSIITWY